MNPDPSILAALVGAAGAKVTIRPPRIDVKLPTDDPVIFAVVYGMLTDYEAPVRRAA